MNCPNCSILAAELEKLNGQYELLLSNSRVWLDDKRELQQKLNEAIEMEQGMRRCAERLQAQCSELKDHVARSDKELCQLQDALGCPAELREWKCSACELCVNYPIAIESCPKCGERMADNGALDAQEAAMERIRDLIALDNKP